MSRVKRGTTHTKKRRKMWSKVKGYLWGRKSKVKLAKTAILKAGKYAYRDRRKKKSEKRRLWQVKINAGARQLGTKYSVLMNGLKKANIELDRKSLANLAQHHPDVFAKVVEKTK